MLAAVDFANPMLWAVAIGWVLTVVLHEFAHGIVAYWGGDYTIRERGGLTLNPLQYVHPVYSILMPIIFLLLGGVPLPGGATYVRRDLLRSRGWESAVSLAGPTMNVLIFVLCALPLHPRFGWANYRVYVEQWTNPQKLLAAIATLQAMAVMFNLVPVPPLDGFGAISPFLDDNTRHKLTTPPLSSFLFFGYFLVIWKVPGVMQAMSNAIEHVLLGMGYGPRGIYYFWNSLVYSLYGS